MAEHFNNEAFNGKNIEIRLYNADLQFKSTILTLKTRLFGLRFLMREWFFTFSLFAIWNLTIAIFLFYFWMYYVSRKNIKHYLLDLRTKQRKKMDLVDSEGEETEVDEGES